MFNKPVKCIYIMIIEVINKTTELHSIYVYMTEKVFVNIVDTDAAFFSIRTQIAQKISEPYAVILF